MRKNKTWILTATIIEIVVTSKPKIKEDTQRRMTDFE